MKKLSILCALLFLFGMSGTGVALTYNGFSPITEDGQSFTFNVSSVESSNDVSGIFIIEARGDYAPTAPPAGVEYLSWDIDGLVSDVEWGSFNADNAIDLGNGYWWSRTIYIDEASLTEITVDGQIVVTIQNSFGVNYFDVDPSPFVSWELSYVPEPTLLGWDYPNGLININPITANYTLVFDSSRQFEAMAFDSENIILYAIENLDGDNLLVSIDYINGSIIDIGYVIGFTEITSMTYDITTSTLYAIDQTTRTLLQINPQTGAGTPISNYSNGTSNALAAHPLTGELYLGWSVDPSYLTKIDKTTGALTIIGSLDINSVTAFEFNPTTLELYATGEFYVGEHQLFTVDLTDASVNPIGTLGQVSSLAFIDYPSEPTIDAILDFFDESVEDGTLKGRGRGWLAKLRLCLMRQLLEVVGEFINYDRSKAACFLLHRAHKRCDGKSPPPDFVEGSATEELAEMILDLMENLGCE